MRHSIVPVLLLATVALSSSNVLPMLSELQQESETLGIDGQQNDNIFSNTFNTRDVFHNLFYKVPVGTTRNEQLTKKMLKYINTNNNRLNFESLVDKEDTYNGEGFRKEQWHNYPRQLDRLHEYLDKLQNSDMKLNPDSYDHDNTNNFDDAPVSAERRSIDDVATNEILLDGEDGIESNYDGVIAATNPLLILRIQLACLNNGIKSMGSGGNYNLRSFQKEHKTDLLEKDELDKLFTNDMDSSVKVKREGTSYQDTEVSDDNTGRKKSVKKRIFSLWSRLHGINHKGHELPHRRHLHAFYSLHDADGSGGSSAGGGVLTAETRATFMRPPGSPLRWG